MRYFGHAYNDRIHERLVALGVDVDLWRDGGALDWNAPYPTAARIANLRVPEAP